MSITGHSQSFRFPFDLFIAESHAELLPELARRLGNTAPLEEGDVIDQIVHSWNPLLGLLFEDVNSDLPWPTPPLSIGHMKDSCIDDNNS